MTDDVLTLTLVNPQTDAEVDAWHDTQMMVSKLMQTYQLDVLADLPQAALTDNWSPEALIQVCSNMKQAISDRQAAQPIQTQIVDQRDVDMTTEDKTALAHSSSRREYTRDGFARTEYTIPTPPEMDFATTMFMNELARLASFFTQALGQHYLLRNNSLIAVATAPVVTAPVVIPVTETVS